MHISKFRIHNYKSYLDSREVNLESGINIITGQNNAGKTALLQALSLSFVYKPHRSSKTLPTSISQITERSTLEFEIELSKADMLSYFRDHLPQIALTFDHNKYHRNEFDGQNFFKKYILPSNKLAISITDGNVIWANLKSLGIGDSCYVYNFNKEQMSLNFSGTSVNANSFLTIATLIKSRFYFFQAERMNIGSYKFGNNSILNSDASNLPEVLEILQGQKARFQRYLNFVRDVFPQIHDISLRPSPGNPDNVEIVVWNENPKHERYDLVVPLSECGTGLGQVLAILYVVLTSDIPKVIIIDEPNSFLHPGACRKLIEILKQHPQHQFIISTHSPSTIAAANPKTINVVRSENAQSSIEAININEANQQQLYLAEIGVKLSDVFGSDNILWVEGKTEEICFPKIIENTKGISLMGTTVLGVKSTGDFQQKKTSDLIFSIYTKLSNGKGLIPQAISFIFDTENQTEKEKQDLARASEGKVKFINRMMYENYLLNPIAIFNILNNISELDEEEIEEGKINRWIEENKWNKKFISKKHSDNQNETVWLQKVDGAKFLSELFSSITEKKVSYDKIKHSVALTEWILENSIHDMKELQELLASSLNQTIIWDTEAVTTELFLEK